MFLEIGMKRNVVLPARDLQRNGEHRRTLVLKLLEELREIEYSKEHGYYVAPTVLKKVSEGRIKPGTGSVEFTVEFDCLVFRLFKNEIVDLEVMQVFKLGCETCCGPYSIFLPAKFMQGFQFKSISQSFRDSRTEIKLRSVVRARIVAVDFDEDLHKIRALATMNGDYLGLLDRSK